MSPGAGKTYFQLISVKQALDPWADGIVRGLSYVSQQIDEFCIVQYTPNVRLLNTVLSEISSKGQDLTVSTYLVDCRPAE